MAMNFDENFDFGKIAEKEVEQYFYNKRYNIIRSYDYKGDENKSPRMFSKIKDKVLPDLDISKDGKRFWVEVKNYTHAVFNRTYKIYVHGIKKRHYTDYLEVEKQTGNIVYLFIKDNEDKKILFIELNKLQIIDCQCGNCGNQCLVYFDKKQFRSLTFS